MRFHYFVKQLGRRISDTLIIRPSLGLSSDGSKTPFVCQLFFVSPLLRFFIYLLAGWWILAADPFGVSTAADRAVTAEVNRVSSFFSPVEQAPITIVLVDFDSIDGLHNNGDGWMAANDWPLTYDDHSRILKTLVTGDEDKRPAAVFYDIFFERPRVITGDMDRFGRQLGLLQSVSGVPIYLAGGGSFMPISDRSYEALQQPRLTATAWQGYGDYYPLKAQLTSPEVPSAIPSSTAPLPALALYKELCRARGESCVWTNADGLPAQAVQWEVQKAEGCRARLDGTGYGPIFSTLLRLMRTLGFSVDVPDATAECLPFHQVRLASLYGESPETLRPPGLAADEHFVVMVGVVMPSMKDYVSSSLYGLVEGVFLHAAALENLNRMGEKYIREKNIIVATLLVWGLAIITVMWWGVRSPERSTATSPSKYDFVLRSKIIRKASWVIGFAILVLVIYFSLYLVFRISPEGWLGIIPLIPLMGEFVITYEKVVKKRFNAANDEKNSISASADRSDASAG